MIALNGINIPFDGTTDLTILSPLFNEMDSYSLPFTIPWCDELRLATNFADHPDTDLIGNEYPFVLSGGGLMYSGVITITDNTEDGLEVAFIDNATFYGKIKGKLLTELTDDIRLLGTDKLKTLSDTLKLEGFDFVCPPFLNSKITEGWGLNVSEKCNEFDSTTEKIKSTNKIVVPMPYLWYAFKRIFNDNGYMLDSWMLHNNYYKRLFLYNNVSLVKYAFSPSENRTNWSFIKITNEKEPTATIFVPYTRNPHVDRLKADDTEPALYYAIPNLGEPDIPITDPSRCMYTNEANTKPITITYLNNLVVGYTFRLLSSNPATNKTTIEANDRIIFDGSWSDGPGEWIEFEKHADMKLYETARGTTTFPSPVNKETVYTIGSHAMVELQNRNVQFECDSEGSYDQNLGGIVYEFKLPFVDSTDFSTFARVYYNVKKIKKGNPTEIVLEDAYEFNPFQSPISFTGPRIESHTPDGEFALPMTIHCDGVIYNFTKPDGGTYGGNLFDIKKISGDKKTITLALDTSEWGDDILGLSWGIKRQDINNYITPSICSNTYDDVNLTKHLPNISITDFLRAIQNYLGWCCFVNEAANTCYIERIDKILTSVTSIDLTAFSSPILFAANEGDKLGIKLAPENEAAFEAVKELPANALIKDSVVNPADLPEVEVNDAYRLVTSTNYWYHFTYQMMGSGGIWEKYGENIILQKGEESYVETVASHIHYDDTAIPSVIRSEQPGTNYKLWNQQERTTPVVLAHYNGYYEHEGKKMPFVSVSDPKFGKFEHNLTLDKETCLYNKVWAPYFYWNKNIRRDGVSTIQWPVHIISALHLWEKVKIGSTLCLVKEIAVTIDHKTDSLTFGDTKLVRC